MPRGRPSQGTDDDELAVPMKIRCTECGRTFYGIATNRCFKCRERKRPEVAADARNNRPSARTGT